MTTVAALCPGSGTKGRKVGPATLRALVRAEFAGQVRDDADYYFCDAQGCDVVYFTADGQTFTKSQLKVAVGVKETTGDRPLCYCFGHSVESIKTELLTLGKTNAVEDIRTKMADPGCSCSTTNPSGACCLGAVKAGVETAKKEVAAKGGRGGRGEVFAKVGAVLSAVVSSSCCWLPLLLPAFGVSGAGIAGTLDVYRPVFIALTVVFLAAAFYFTYRPRRASAAGADCCAAAPTTRSRFSMMALNKVVLWGVTVLAVAFLFFPQYMRVFLTGGGNVEPAANNPTIRTTTFAVEGMTCEGCSALVEKVVKEVPGVLSVRVDYDAKRMVVTSEACCPAPTEAVVQALQKAGYRAAVVTPEPTTGAARTSNAPRGDCCEKPAGDCCQSRPAGRRPSPTPSRSTRSGRSCSPSGASPDLPSVASAAATGSLPCWRGSTRSTALRRARPTTPAHSSASRRRPVRTGRRWRGRSRKS